jgi:signal transduction histidine kinase
MHQQRESALEKRYLADEESQVKRAYCMLVRLGLFVIPLFTVSDWFTYRESFVQLSWIRGTIFSIFGIFYLLARRGIHPGGAIFSGTLLLSLSSVAITTMCFYTGGYPSEYYAGINLLTMTVVIIFSGNFRHAMRAVLAVNLVYVGGMAIRFGLPSDQIPSIASNFVFLAATSMVALTSAFITERASRQSFAHRLESEKVDQIRIARDAAQHALEIRDEFIAVASHELNTPLTSMKLRNDMVRRRFSDRDPPTTEQVAGLVDQNARQLSRLIRLVDDMLDISRITSGRMTFRSERVDLAELVNRVCADLRLQLARADISLNLVMEGFPIGNWDPSRIEQVVSNLLSNTAKYAPGSHVEVVVREEQGRAVVEVGDDGPGIDPVHQSRIFDRFERAFSYRAASGLGLGLYISRCILEGHRGSISVESVPGRGATFRIELPSEISGEVAMRESRAGFHLSPDV